MEQNGICMDPTWACISSYFTQKDIDCMSNYGLELDQCASVLENAGEIYKRVLSGNMPKGGTRWTPEMCANFKAWSETANPCG